MNLSALSSIVCIFLWSVETIYCDEIGNANAYVDKVLENLRKDPKLVNLLESLSVPDVVQSDFQLRNAKVKGLSQAYRHGDCSLSYSDDGGLEAIVELGVNSLRINGNYRAWASFFWASGDIQIAIAHLAVKVDLTSKDGNARVQYLKVVDFGATSVPYINGLSFFLNWALKLIANNMIQNSRGMIQNALEHDAVDEINNMLKQYKFPIYYSVSGMDEKNFYHIQKK
ncbi:uncharacterized protein LOC129222855 [Uloborus diversus]|uniref:uncharacterized protein LOC129222855 n=1 Tax=Uloborus diversus TaxID=327109 RepID=UPI00240A6048|nr:uncharacterized protein LOC129222855 [Uloborus diversus]